MALHPKLEKKKSFVCSWVLVKGLSNIIQVAHLSNNLQVVGTLPQLASLKPLEASPPCVLKVEES